MLKIEKIAMTLQVLAGISAVGCGIASFFNPTFIPYVIGSVGLWLLAYTTYTWVHNKTNTQEETLLERATALRSQQENNN